MGYMTHTPNVPSPAASIFRQRVTLTWPEFVAAVTDGDSGQEVARKTGIAGSTISRWLSGHSKRPDVSQVERLAAAYGISAAAAMASAGYGLGQQDAVEVPRVIELRQFTDDELLRELRRRLSRSGEGMLDQK